MCSGRNTCLKIKRYFCLLDDFVIMKHSNEKSLENFVLKNAKIVQIFWFGLVNMIILMDVV